MIAPTSNSNSFLARADSRGTLDDDTRTGTASERSKSTASSMRKLPMKSQAVKLMNPHCRPWWSGSLSTGKLIYDAFVILTFIDYQILLGKRAVPI